MRGRAVSAALLLALLGCTAQAPGRTANGYDFTGVKAVKVNGEELAPVAALAALARNRADVLNQIPAQSSPLPGDARIVLPDHDRLRVLAVQSTRQPSGGVVEWVAENQRLDLQFVAAAVARSRAFAGVSVVEQNDTVAPEVAGADYLIWFQVRSITPNNAGPWVGLWQMKRAGGAGTVAVNFDPGSPPGPARLLSFVSSAQAGAARLSGGSVAVSSAGGTRRAVSGGTGTVVDGSGHVLTNDHVITGCPDIRVTDGRGASTAATLVATDATADLALLKTEQRSTVWAHFRDSRGLRAGESLVVTGYPLSGVVSPEMAVTTGSLTALAGARGDSRQLQFSAPIQPGNSGGPVLDDSGRVIGVASSMLNGLAIAALTGALPQNVNFAIKSDIARDFLGANQVSMDAGPSRTAMGAAAVGDLARRFTVKIECWR